MRWSSWPTSSRTPWPAVRASRRLRAQLDTKLVRLQGVESSGAAASGPTKEKLLDSDRFLRVAFETGEAQLSDLTETPDGGYFIVRVDRVDPPALEPFDKVRKDVEAAWRNDTLANAARERANKLLEELRAGRSLDTVAAEAGLSVARTSAFTRYDQSESPRLPGALVAELFRVKLGEAVDGPAADGHTVAVLHRIEPAAAKAEDPAFDALSAELTEAIAADVLEQYTRSLRRLYPVRIDTAALDRLFDEGFITR